MIQGYAVHAAGAEVQSYRFEPGELAPDEVEVAVSHCGVCHSDIGLIDNEWGYSRYPFVPGHEIVGTVVEAGAQAGWLKPGDRVGVGWQAASCGHCEWCRKGEEQFCAGARFTCVGRHGGFADRVRVQAHFAVPLPDALDPAAAAPLLCAGATVYAPLRGHGVHPASRVGVVGIGGLGHLALQFARAFGAEVTAFSSSAAKEEECMRLGAHHFVNTRETKTLKALGGHFDLILCTGTGEEDWNAYGAALRPHGSLSVLGLISSPASLSLRPFVSRERSLGGGRTGSPAEIAEMLQVAARHRIAPVIEQFPMREANAAVERVRKGQARYRAVLAN